MAKLSKEERDKLPESDFAVPEKRDLPIQDEDHVRMAWNMVEKTEDLSNDERAEARKRILRRAKELGIDTSEWNKLEASFRLSALAMQVPEFPDHPNRIPFSGTLTHVDSPSDRAPGGSGGRRVILERSATRDALPSLLGMAVDCTMDLDGHDPQNKIGIITEAVLSHENEVHIKGFFYGSDFPLLVDRIRAAKDELGWSYEILAKGIDRDSDPIRVTDFIFTGAAVLFKSAAAYHNTSLAANAEGNMPNETLEQRLARIEAEREEEKKEKERKDKDEREERERKEKERKEKEEEEKKEREKKDKEKMEAASEHASRLRKIALDIAPFHHPHAEELHRIADQIEGKNVEAKALEASKEWKDKFYYTDSLYKDRTDYRDEFNRVDRSLDQPGNPITAGGGPQRKTMPGNGSPSSRFDAGDVTFKSVQELDDYCIKAGMAPEESIKFKLRYMRSIS